MTHLLGEPVHTYPNSALHVEEQPSSLTVLPSSHFSLEAVTLSPQVDQQVEGWFVEHANPPSTVHAVEQPSPAFTFLSSQASMPVMSPSPQPALMTVRGAELVRVMTNAPVLRLRLLSNGAATGNVALDALFFRRSIRLSSAVRLFADDDDETEEETAGTLER